MIEEIKSSENGITVLSLFDGMSCGQLALQKLGIRGIGQVIENKLLFGK